MLAYKGHDCINKVSVTCKANVIGLNTWSVETVTCKGNDNGRHALPVMAHA